MRRFISGIAAIASALASLSLAAGCTPQEAAGSPNETAAGDAKRQLGLMTTLPILWSGESDFGKILSADAQPHWALPVLSEGHDVAALDVLTPSTLGKLDLLVLAQPRMLSGEENVALDTWVREGGHVLIFADPMLTEHSEFGIGDKRRPQDVVLLDTILARWGLVLDAGAPELETVFMQIGKAQLPLRSQGFFRRRDPAGGAKAACEDVTGPTLVRCNIGSGQALILADAAILEAHYEAGSGIDEGSAAALKELLGMAGETVRSRSGNTRE